MMYYIYFKSGQRIKVSQEVLDQVKMIQDKLNKRKISDVQMLTVEFNDAFLQIDIVQISHIISEGLEEKNDFKLYTTTVPLTDNGTTWNPNWHPTYY